MDFEWLPGSIAEQIDRACDEFELAWNEGLSPRIEAYLDRTSDAGRPTLLRAMLLTELELRRDEGESPSVEEYLSRFPTEITVVRDVFDATEMASGQEPLGSGSASVEMVTPRVDDRLLARASTLVATAHFERGQRTPSVPLPEQIGPYEQIRFVAKGGFGLVYRAYHKDLDRDVAIKVARDGRFATRAEEDLLLEEARLAAKLKHPGIVTVYGCGRIEGDRPYVVFEFLEGQTLARTLSAERLPHDRLARLLAKVSDAAYHAHQAGLIHRDLTPANIVIDSKGEPHVTDFGLAVTDDLLRLRSGEIAGTPSHMSPEQVRGETHRLDGRTDVWAIGVTLYLGLTGHLPFEGRNRGEIFDEILNRDPKPPRQFCASIPRELERICLACLAKRTSLRYSSAVALGEDLRAWLDQPETIGVAASSSSPTAARHFEVAPSDVATTPRIVPRGLRYFTKEDAGFFLSLLPGPRGRDGLPESVRFWKTWIEDRDGDDAFSVGLLYGPSGGGKSSLIRAGVLPRVDPLIETIYVEASPDRTEAQLLAALKRHLPTPLGGAGLVEAMVEARESCLVPSSKVLIVLDQFEQWLHAHPDEPDSELVRALRHCDGHRCQALLLVRDDFWMAVTRLFKALEVPLVEGTNSAPVEMFDMGHARKILAEFGRATGRLPAGPESLGPEAELFLDRAVREMTGPDGRVIPVQLSVFTEMVQRRPWTPETLRDLGGVKGIGVRFLEETFDSRTAPPSHRIHAKAAQATLKRLLPSATSVIRGGGRSASVLCSAAGYDGRPGDFADLMHVLVNELKIVTLVDLDGTRDEVSGPGETSYQLAHDFLVGPIREWVERKELATPAGRARYRLSLISASWADRPSQRNLPSILEWIGIHWYTRRRDWSTAERRMMRAADRNVLVRAAAAATIVATVAIGVEQLREKERAGLMLARALKADYRNLPGLYSELTAYRDRVQGDLERLERDGSAAARDRDVALLLLHRTSPTPDRAAALRRWLRVAGPDEVALIREALATDPASAGDAELRRALFEDDDPAVRLRVASALAGRGSVEESAWRSVADPLAEALLCEDRRTIPRWLELLDPIVPLLTPSFARVCAEPDRDPSTRSTAAETLIGATSGQDDLAGLARAATESQPDAALVLLRELQRTVRRDPAMDYLRDLLASSPDGTGDDALIARQTMAVVALAFLGDSSAIGPALQHRSDPRLRTSTIRKIATLGLAHRVLPPILSESTVDPAERQGVLLAWAESPPGRPTSAVRADVISAARAIFRDDSDPGVHSAAELLLRRWDHDRPPAILVSAPAPVSANDRRWEPGPNGQTMVILPGPRTFRMGSPIGEPDRFPYENLHYRRIDRSIAVATTEVTARQYRAFNKDYLPEARYAKDLDCPAGGISWYDALRYCNRLSKEAGIKPGQWCYPEPIGPGMTIPADAFDRTGFRLPTEAEWESFCRAGSETCRPFGNDYLNRYAWTYLNAKGMSHPSGRLLPNEFGLFDTLGSLWEWCHDGPTGTDLYPAYPEGTKESPATDGFCAVTVQPENWRIVRGGVFDVTPAMARSAHRDVIRAGSANYATGFRVVRTLAHEGQR